MPDSISNWGEAIAPALRMISSRLRAWGGRRIAGRGAELDVVAVGVVNKQERLPVVTDSFTFNLEPVLLKDLFGALEVLNLERMVDIVRTRWGIGGLDEMHHNPIFQLKPGDVGVLHLTLDLFDADQVVVKLHGPGGVLDHGSHMINHFGINLPWHSSPLLIYRLTPIVWRYYAINRHG